jgi:hypothetical protein
MEVPSVDRQISQSSISETASVASEDEEVAPDSQQLDSGPSEVFVESVPDYVYGDVRLKE